MTNSEDLNLNNVSSENANIENVASVNDFSPFNLAPALIQALAALDIHSPTPVQTTVLPLVDAGRDLMVSSKTGSGKTFGFLLPTINRLLGQTQSPLKATLGPAVLVLCPTRELAQQVSQDAINLVKFTKGQRIATVVGGMPYGKQVASIRGASVVIGTPGRLLDLANQGSLQLNAVHALVVDEADRMLDLGFADDLEALHGLCCNRQQTLMFSATFAPRITSLARNIMNNPEKIELTAPNATNTDITQKLMWADNKHHKRKLLNHWLSQPDLDQAVIFTSTQMDAENLAKDLLDEGVRACALHGAMPQVVRNRRLASVRRKDVQILVATDVAARGLDVPTISHVINYGMPMKPEDYVHRIGRTGRAGRTGTAITLAEIGDMTKVRAVERFMSNQIPEEQVPGLEPKGNFVRGQKPSGQGGKRRSFGGGGSGSSSWGGGGGSSWGGRRDEKRSDDRRGDDKRPFSQGPSNGDSRPGQRPEYRTERRPDQRPDFRTDQRPDFRTDQRPDFRTDQRPDFRTDQRPEYRTERRPEFRTDQRPDFRSERPRPAHADKPGQGQPARRFEGGPRRTESKPQQRGQFQRQSQRG